LRGPKPTIITLTTRQSELLHQITRRQSAAQQLVRRARLILLAARGLNNTIIGTQLGLARGNVRTWRERWLAAADQLGTLEADLDDKQLAARIDQLLRDEPRPGTPPSFSPEQVVQIIALACEDPQLSQRPISNWTPPELAAEAQKRGIVTTVSASSVRRFLKSGRSQAPFKPLLVASQS
jgi:putative transposase